MQALRLPVEEEGAIQSDLERAGFDGCCGIDSIAERQLVSLPFSAVCGLGSPSCGHDGANRTHVNHLRGVT